MTISFSDLDECMFEPCDIGSSSCENVPGTYECPCLVGFYRLTKEVCQSKVLVFVSFCNELWNG